MDEKTVGVIVATPWEAKPLIRALRLRASQPNRYERGFDKARVVLAVCGIGQQAARHTALMLSHRKLSLLISCGYGGALQPGIRAGDLALDVTRSDASFIHSIKTIARKQKLKLHEGAFMSARKILATPEDKKAAGTKSWGALIAEMESRGVYDACQEKKIPFGSLRAVSDESTQRLPQAAVAVDPKGKLTGEFWKALLTRPAEWADIVKLSRTSHKANKSLGKILSLYFEGA